MYQESLGRPIIVRILHSTSERERRTTHLQGLTTGLRGVESYQSSAKLWRNGAGWTTRAFEASRAALPCTHPCPSCHPTRPPILADRGESSKYTTISKAALTHTMIGPSLGTFSPPTTWISLKNETTAQPAMRRMMRCITFASDIVKRRNRKVAAVGDGGGRW